MVMLHIRVGGKTHICRQWQLLKQLRNRRIVSVVERQNALFTAITNLGERACVVGQSAFREISYSLSDEVCKRIDIVLNADAVRQECFDGCYTRATERIEDTVAFTTVVLDVLSNDIVRSSRE